MVELATAVGTTKQNLNNHRSRGTFPEKLLRRAADRFGVNYEWLVGGKPPFRIARKASAEDLARALQLMGLPKEIREDCEQIFKRLRDSPRHIPWVAGLLKILSSNSEGSVVGIQESINAFLARLGVPEIPITGNQRREKPAKKLAR